MRSLTKFLLCFVLLGSFVYFVIEKDNTEAATWSCSSQERCCYPCAGDVCDALTPCSGSVTDGNPNSCNPNPNCPLGYYECGAESCNLTCTSGCGGLPTPTPGGPGGCSGWPTPQCNNISASVGCVNPGGSYTVAVNNALNLSKIDFISYNPPNINTVITSRTGSPWSVTVNQSSHQSGDIITAVYADNACYNDYFCGNKIVPLCTTCEDPVWNAVTYGASCDGSGNKMINWSWQSVPGAGATSYRLQISNSSSFTTLAHNQVYSGTTASVNLSATSTWYARVRVETNTGACITPGAWSPPLSANAPDCPAPTTPPCTAVLALTPATFTEVVPNSEAFTATVTSISPAGCVTGVNFSESSAAFSISPLSDTASPYATTTTCAAAGTGSITASAMSGSTVVSTDTSTLTCGVATPTPGSAPGCTPWVSIQIDGSTGNGCSQSEYPSGADCQTTTAAVTLLNNSSTATQMRHQNVDPSILCANVTMTAPWIAYSPTRAWTLTSGGGAKKVCAQFSNTSGAGGNCGAQINLTSTATVAPTSPVPSNTPIPPTTIPPTPVPTSTTCSCTANLIPSSASVNDGSSTPFSMSVSNITAGCSVSQVNFATSNSSVANLSPLSDSSLPYLTNATGQNPGSTTISGQVIMSDGKTGCSDSSPLSVIGPTPTPIGPTNPPLPTVTPIPTSTPIPTATPTPVPSCTVSLNYSPATISMGQNTVATANVAPVNGTVGSVNFSVTSGSAGLSPGSDSTNPYQSTVTPTAPGTVTVRAGVIMAGIERCSTTQSLTVSNPTCTVNLTPVSATIGFNQNAGFSTFVTNASSPVSQVTYSTSNSSVAAVSPGIDSASPYATTATGGSVPGTATITSRAFISGFECGFDTSTVNVLAPSCTLDLTPVTSDIELGSSRNYYASVLVSPNPPYTSSSVSSVNFSVADPAVAGVNPTSDTDPLSPAGGYQTSVTGLAIGTTTLQAEGIMFGTSYCNDSAEVNVLNPPAWWQVKEGDIVAVVGDMATDIPFACSLPVCEPLFITNDPGEEPGIPSYSGSLTTGTDYVVPQSISSKGWNVNSAYLDTSVFNYDYFEQKLPVTPANIGSSIISGSALQSGGVSYNGYSIYRYSGGGDLTINGDSQISGGRKVILFVQGGVNVNGHINVTDGTSFFMVMAQGDIEVSPALGANPLPHLEGLFYTQGVFRTLSLGDDSDIPLYIRGSVVGLSAGGIDFQRDLNPSLSANNSNTPAEKVEFAPDQILMYPKFLGVKSVRWREVAP